MSNENVLKAIGKNLQDLYHPDSLFVSNLTDDQINIVELSTMFCKNGKHPGTVLTSDSYVQLKQITGIDFDKLIIGVEDSFVTPVPTYDSFLESLLNKNIHTTTQETDNVDSVKPNKIISCKSYSCGNNLSKDYEYANSVDFPSCSNPNIIGMHCVSPNECYRCPFYTQDSELFSTYELSYLEDTYSYTVNKYRHVNGNSVYQIFDYQNNLLNELSFSLEDHSAISPEDFNVELKSIVNQLHKNIYFENEFSLTESTLEESDSIISKKSYFATLIS